MIEQQHLINYEITRIRLDLRRAKFEFSCIPFLQDLLNILPMMDSLVLLDVDGDQLHQALENGVSQWPKLDGRYPQVSGIFFAFDPSKPPGSRVDIDYVKIGSEYLERERHYKLITKSFLANGEDGYSSLSQGTVLVEDDSTPTLTGAVINHFQALEIRNGKASRTSVHHQSIIPRSRRKDVDAVLMEEEACKLEPKVEGRILQMTAKVSYLSLNTARQD